MTDQERDAEVWALILEQRAAKAVAKWTAEVPPRFQSAKWENVDDKLRAAWEPLSGRNLVLSGSVGTGKTWALWAAVREAAIAAKPWHVIRWPDFVDSLRPSDDTGGTDPRAAATTADVLAIDEFGSGRITDFVLETLERLVDARWTQGRQTIITTNLSVGRDGDLRAWTGERVWSRLTDGAVRFNLAGESRRGS